MGLRAAPLLLLLMAALLLVGACASQEQYERFLLQHVDARPKGRDDRYCTDRMRHVLKEDRRRDPQPGPKVCKETNTFVHGSREDVRAVCTGQGGQEHVSRARQRLRQSLRPFQVTTCTLHSGRPLENCQYRAARSSRTLVLACDEHEHPVHFAESWI